MTRPSWDLIEKAIEDMLNDHMRTWGWYDYFVVNDVTVLVKVFDENDEVRFTIKAKLNGEKLEVVEVS
jgi:hypothetical protein